MIFLKAFLISGVFCLLTQLLFRLSKRSVLSVLTVTFLLGVAFSALGWLTPLGNWGQAGLYMLLYGAADAAYQGWCSLLAGDWVPIVRYACLIFIYCFAIGLAGGVLLHNKRKKKRLNLELCFSARDQAEE